MAAAAGGSVEEVCAYTDEGEIYPWLVLYKVGKLLEREFLGTHWLQTFLGHQTAGESHHGSHYSKTCTKYSILMCLGSSNHLLKIGEG